MDARRAYRMVAGLDTTPLSYNESRDAMEAVHRDAQWREITVYEAVRRFIRPRRLDDVTDSPLDRPYVHRVPSTAELN